MGVLCPYPQPQLDFVLPWDWGFLKIFFEEVPDTEKDREEKGEGDEEEEEGQDERRWTRKRRKHGVGGRRGERGMWK